MFTVGHARGKFKGFEGGRVLPEDAASRYHAGHDPRLAEALVNNREAASISAIFREVRAAIYAGEYQAGAQLPTRAEFARRKKVSAESITIVMRMLAAEGIVSSEQGRGTFVLPRRQFRVSAAIGRTEGSVPAGVVAPLQRAQEAEPAASSLTVDEHAVSSLSVSVTIETGSLAQAVTLAMAVFEDALRPGGGWDLSGASVSARPA